MLSEDQWGQYGQDGFLHLGPVVDAAGLDRLRRRVDDLAAGRVPNPLVEFQVDTGGEYELLPEAVKQLPPGTDRYRKVQGLEHDDLYGRLVRHPLFVEICARQYGPHAPVSLFRAMVMNKPARQGTRLPWHQDGGSVWDLDRDPLVTVWIALDAATPENGCMDVVPGSHRLGLLSWYGSTVSEEGVARYCPPEAYVPLPVEAGHGVLVHNWLLHRSGINPTDSPRRAFTCCFMDGRTRRHLTGTRFPLMWGELHDETSHLEELRAENAELFESQRQAEQYALSLKEANQVLHESVAEVTRYARSLEHELQSDRTVEEQAIAEQLPSPGSGAFRPGSPARLALVAGVASVAASGIVRYLPAITRRLVTRTGHTGRA
jgi:hypothetical protein